MNGSVEPETPPDSPSMDVGIGKPPRHQLTSIRHCASSARIAAAASSNFGLDLGTLSLISPTDVRPGFLPVFRSGSCADTGPKSYMEDEHVCVDNLIEHLGGRAAGIPAPGAFYGVFDGHGGTDAACFVRKNILKFIMEDAHFPNNMEKAMRRVFVKADHALADSHSLDHNSGTTALTALIFGRAILQGPFYVLNIFQKLLYEGVIDSEAVSAFAPTLLQYKCTTESQYTPRKLASLKYKPPSLAISLCTNLYYCSCLLVHHEGVQISHHSPMDAAATAMWFGVGIRISSGCSSSSGRGMQRSRRFWLEAGLCFPLSPVLASSISAARLCLQVSSVYRMGQLGHGISSRRNCHVS